MNNKPYKEKCTLTPVTSYELPMTPLKRRIGEDNAVFTCTAADQSCAQIGKGKQRQHVYSADMNGNAALYATCNYLVFRSSCSQPEIVLLHRIVYHESKT